MSILDDFDPAPRGRRIKLRKVTKASKLYKSVRSRMDAYRDERSEYDAKEGAAELRMIHAPGWGPVHVKAHTRKGKVVKGYTRRKK